MGKPEILNDDINYVLLVVYTSLAMNEELTAYVRSLMSDQHPATHYQTTDGRRTVIHHNIMLRSLENLLG